MYIHNRVRHVELLPVEFSILKELYEFQEVHTPTGFDFEMKDQSKVHWLRVSRRSQEYSKAQRVAFEFLCNNWMLVLRHNVEVYAAISTEGFNQMQKYLLKQANPTPPKPSSEVSSLHDFRKMRHQKVIPPLIDRKQTPSVVPLMSPLPKYLDPVYITPETIQY